MGGTLTLFRIRGIPVQVHLSWLVIVGLLTWTLSVGYFPRVVPDLPAGAYWTRGLLATLLLFVSVFLHELAHALVARGYGIPVRSITLHVFGGVSEMEREPDRPGIEFLVAVVGPLTSFGLAALLAAVHALTDPARGTSAIMGYLVLVNTVLGVFNLVPGFPLDGGRLLRAALWKLRGDLLWASRMASGAGTTVAFLLIGLGIFRAFSGEFIGGVWFVLIGLFLRQAAEGSYQQLLVRRALAPLRVRDIMARDVVRVPPDMTIREVVEDYFWRHRVSSFPVVEADRVVGILTLRDLRTVPPEQREERRVRDVMVPRSDALVASPRDSAWKAFQRLSRNGVGRVAVLDGETLVGYLSVRDVMHVLAIRVGADGETEPLA